MSANILLVGSTDRQLEETLRACGMQAPALAGAELAALAQPLARQPDVLVLDVRDQNHLPTALPLLKRQHPNTGVIIVTSRLEPALLLEAMRAGVTEVVSNITEDELRSSISRLLASHPAATAAGQAYAFLGAKGGVGTTTVAVNVATALARLDPNSTLLIDLHVTNGDAAVFLGAEPRFSIVDAMENTHRLDESFFKTLVVKTKSGVDLLASSDRVMVNPVDVRRIRTILEFAERHYRHIVLDVPRSDAAVLDALETVSQIVVVANQELATVRSASRIAAALRQRYGKDRLTVVVSRSDRLADIGHEDVERAVGSPVKFTFPSDYRRALQALNKGVPVTVDNHNELSSAFVRFAKALTGVQKKESKDRPAARFSIFGARKGAAQETR
ncbi:MAG TPA: AAA family ATPase [Vicinamibacterales bacterium]|nr:AAA family ATPase [Vicinamibacterales bacterium]